MDVGRAQADVRPLVGFTIVGIGRQHRQRGVGQVERPLVVTGEVRRGDQGVVEIRRLRHATGAAEDRRRRFVDAPRPVGFAAVRKAASDAREQRRLLQRIVDHLQRTFVEAHRVDEGVRSLRRLPGAFVEDPRFFRRASGPIVVADVGDALRVLGFQRCSDPAVQRPQLGGQELVRHRLAGERVPEAIGPGPLRTSTSSCDSHPNRSAGTTSSSGSPATCAKNASVKGRPITAAIASTRRPSG